MSLENEGLILPGTIGEQQSSKTGFGSAPSCAFPFKIHCFSLTARRPSRLRLCAYSYGAISGTSDLMVVFFVACMNSAGVSTASNMRADLTKEFVYPANILEDVHEKIFFNLRFHDVARRAARP